MCGIVGYIGNKDVDSVVLVGLEKLEYRGYDSAGIAALHQGKVQVIKRAGRLRDLYSLVNGTPLDGPIALGHTRWATHGKPTDANAHPHTDCSGTIAVAHNGIIENFQDLRAWLSERGHTFTSDTDSEVIPHLIETFMDEGLPLFEAVLRTIERLEGSFALVIFSSREPDRMIGVRKDSPLVLGVGRGEMFLASDIPAILSHTRDVVVLDNEEMALITRDAWQVFDFQGRPKPRTPRKVSWDVGDVHLGPYPHYMLKEIHEQPEVIARILQTYVRREGVQLLKDFNLRRLLLSKHRILIQAAGTSLHAGMVGKYLLERLARIQTDVEFSSEFRYREPVVDSHTLVVAISQSGETADTLAGVRLAKELGLEVLSVVNVQDSSIARESDYVLYLQAGPEIGVASTKAYTAQLTVLTLLALELGMLKGEVSESTYREILDAFQALPEAIQEVLVREPAIQHLAQRYAQVNHFMFLGRGIHFPTALEGALKLKEISYIHATGYAAGEMKHGPLALVDRDWPVVVVNPRTSVWEKTLSNTMEIRAREGRVISVINQGDTHMRDVSDEVIEIPSTHEVLSPILAIVPLQLLAYHVALIRGCDVDKPRNLAKSVTVE
ncbi:MAG: glutamine--fructose-6-phosphate transaminase (isomerizing) [Candidatus Hydrothermae bacterium]|nr:glutamine--fructose-6-phosphate transaminase (isomerizing) [Candidatus Hydrothermae bacterium]